MPGNITNNFNLGNGARFIFGRFDLNDDTKVATVVVELRTAVAGPQPDAPLCSFTSIVRNGTCTQHSRQAAPAPGLPINAQARYIVEGSRVVANGYDAVKTAERAAADGQATRRAALEAFWLSAGHIDPATLAYT